MLPSTIFCSLNLYFAQLCGAICGGALLFWLMVAGDGFSPDGIFQFGGITEGIGFTDKASYLATNVCQPGVSQGFALLTETLLTFLFVFVVLGATSKWGHSALAGVAIGLTLGLVNIVGIPVDNCSVNPARAFGPAIFSIASHLARDCHQGASAPFFMTVFNITAIATLKVVDRIYEVV